MPHNIQENAILIADAHSMGEDGFYQLLVDIDSGDIECSELYLLGDIYELLFGDIEYIVNENQTSIDLLNKISKTIDIVYFEGNHDFHLKKLFRAIKIIKIQEQPVKYRYKNKTIYISHGDNNLTFGYRMYTKIIRNKIVLKSLNLIDKISKNKISKKLYNTVPHKARYNKISNFKDIVDKRVLNYDDDKDYIIEGHYHQDKIFVYNNFEYINMPSFKVGGYKRIQELVKA